MSLQKADFRVTKCYKADFRGFSATKRILIIMTQYQISKVLNLNNLQTLQNYVEVGCRSEAEEACVLLAVWRACSVQTHVSTHSQLQDVHQTHSLIPKKTKKSVSKPKKNVSFAETVDVRYF